MDISKRIYELRKKKQVSQEELANNLNVSRQAVSKWESNQTLPDLEKVVLMSEFFGVSTDYILTGKDKSGDYVLSTDQQMNKNWSAKKLGILVSLVSLICIIILCILGSVKGGDYYEYGDKNIELHGIRGFLATYNLTWLAILLILTVLVGIALILFDKYKRIKTTEEN